MMETEQSHKQKYFQKVLALPICFEARVQASCGAKGFQSDPIWRLPSAALSYAGFSRHQKNGAFFNMSIWKSEKRKLVTTNTMEGSNFICKCVFKTV